MHDKTVLNKNSSPSCLVQCSSSAMSVVIKAVQVQAQYLLQP